jgi:hypothetical protein
VEEHDADGILPLVTIGRISSAPHVSKEITGGNVVSAHAVGTTVDDKKLVAL